MMIFHSWNGLTRVPGKEPNIFSMFNIQQRRKSMTRQEFNKAKEVAAVELNLPGTGDYKGAIGVERAEDIATTLDQGRSELNKQGYRAFMG